MIIEYFSIILLFLQGDITPYIFDFSDFSATFSGDFFMYRCDHYSLAHLGFLVRVTLDALLLPWGSLARWRAFLIYPFPRMLTSTIHGCSSCTLSDCDGRVSTHFPVWILCTITRFRFSGGSCYPFPAGLILWNSNFLLRPLFGAFTGGWLVLVLLHDWCLIQLPTLYYLPSKISSSVGGWFWQEEVIDNS